MIPPEDTLTQWVAIVVVTVAAPHTPPLYICTYARKPMARPLIISNERMGFSHCRSTMRVCTFVVLTTLVVSVCAAGRQYAIAWH